MVMIIDVLKGITFLLMFISNNTIIYLKMVIHNNFKFLQMIDQMKLLKCQINILKIKYKQPQCEMNKIIVRKSSQDIFPKRLGKEEAEHIKVLIKLILEM